MSWKPNNQIQPTNLRFDHTLCLPDDECPRIESASENQYFSNWNSIGLYWSVLLNQKEKALIGRCQTALSPVMTHYQFWLYTDKSSRKLDVRFFLLTFLCGSYFPFPLLLTSDLLQWIIKFSRVKSEKMSALGIMMEKKSMKLKNHEAIYLHVIGLLTSSLILMSYLEAI